MDTRDVNSLMTQALAEKERDDLEQLGRAQTFRAILENAKESAVVSPLEKTPRAE